MRMILRILRKNNLFKKLRILILSIILCFKKFNIQNSIIICSYPRGGSTWLLELIGSVEGMIINWEPLHVKYGVVPNDLFLGETPTLIPNDLKNESYLHLFTKILTYKKLNSHSMLFVGARQAFNSNYVVTKFCRANMLLPWLTHSFKFKFRPILLLRHPIPVSLSVLKSWYNNTEKLLSLKELPNTLNKERYEVFLPYINGLQTRLEQQVALWCMEHESLLGFNNSKWKIVFYEHILQNPEIEMIKIFNFWNLEIDQAEISILNFKKASRSVFYKDELKQESKIQIEKYLDIVDNNTLKKIQNVFDDFNLKVYKANSPYPLLK